MSADHGGPGTTTVRRQLGRKLQRLREAANKTHEDVAAAQIMGRTKLWQVETGKVRVKDGDVLALSRFYGVDGLTTDALLALAAGTRDPGHWEEFAGAVPEWQAMYADLEGATSGISIWHPELVHGLFQTEGYIRALMEAHGGFTPEETDRRTAFRLQRQRAVLEAQPPRSIAAVLGAGALMLVVGSGTVMEEQRVHLRELGERDNIAIKVWGWAAGVHPATKGAFTVLDFADPDDPPVVFVETHLGARYLDRDDQLAEYRRMFDVLMRGATAIEEIDSA